MIKVSNFSSLWFGAWRNTFDQEADYVQKFAEGDNIVVQIQGTTARDTFINVQDTDTGEWVNFDYWHEPPPRGGSTNIKVAKLNLPVGNYVAEVGERGVEAGDPSDVYGTCRFCVLPAECLQGTVKLTYTHRRNDYDTLFIHPDSSETLYFDIRFEGGFIFRDTEYAVEEETFRNQRYVQRLTSAFPYHKQVLTLGNGHGVPEWAGMKLNLIFSLSSVEVDGRKYVRSDGEVPERTDLLDYYPLYVWKLGVEPDDFYNTELQATDDGVPDGALTDNLGNLLTDNLGNYLTAN